MSNFFDASGMEFSVSMRGYDRTQVDHFARQISAMATDAENERAAAETSLADLRTALRRNEDQIAVLHRQLAETTAQIAENQQPTLAGLGARVERELRASENDAAQQREQALRQAAEIRDAAAIQAALTTQTAKAEAEELTAAARREAEQSTATARTEIAQLRETAQRDSHKLRADTTRDVDRQRASANHEVAETRAGADRDIAVNRAAMDREVTKLRATAASQVEQQRAEAARLLAEAAETRRSQLQNITLAQAERREQAEREHTQRHTDAIARAQRIVTEAEERWTKAEQRARQTRRRADERESEADQRSDEIAVQARESVAAELANATTEAERLRSEAVSAAEELVLPLQDEVDELKLREESVSSKLDDLRRQLGSIAGPGFGSFDAMPEAQPLPVSSSRHPRTVETPTQQIPAIS